MKADDSILKSLQINEQIYSGNYSQLNALIHMRQFNRIVEV